VAAGYDSVDELRICSLNPAKHYKLNVGLLQQDDAADFVVVNSV